MKKKYVIALILICAIVLSGCGIRIRRDKKEKVVNPIQEKKDKKKVVCTYYNKNESVEVTQDTTFVFDEKDVPTNATLTIVVTYDESYFNNLSSSTQEYLMSTLKEREEEMLRNNFNMPDLKIKSTINKNKLTLSFSLDDKEALKTSGDSQAFMNSMTNSGHKCTIETIKH
jgi:hypothetical protein